MISEEEADRLRSLSPEDRLKEISLMWYVETNAGYPFMYHTSSVPKMRLLLEGYDHPNTLEPKELEARQ